MPSGLALALLVAMTTACPAAAQVVSEERDPYGRQALAGYFAIVATYRAGRIGDAAATLLVWPDADVDQAVRGLVRLRGKIRRCTVLPDEIAAADLDAAVMLHTDAATGAYNRDDWPHFFFHLDHARKLVELRHLIDRMWADTPELARDGCRPPPPLTRRDWYFAVATSLQGLWELPTADRLAGFGLEAAPDDAAMLLAAGSIKEALAYGAARDPGLPPSDQLSGSAFSRVQNRRLGELQAMRRDRRDAAALFERALATGAAPLETRLRLGRVWAQMDRRADAREALGEVLASEPTAEERYLACLFLGRVSEQDGDPAAAAGHFRRAVDSQPHGQAARVALVHALEQTGDAGGPALLAAVLAEPWPRDGGDDPWWIYYFGQFRAGRRTLDELRQRVMVQ